MVLKMLLIRLRNRFIGIESIESLKKKGLNVGKNLSKNSSCIIDSSHCWLISLGDDVTLAPRVIILAHDASTFRHLGYTKIGLVSIGNRTFVGANSVVLPNVRIGNNVIIGAGSVVTKDIPDNCIAAGNPAIIIGKTDDFLRKHAERMKTRPVFDDSWTINYGINQSKKDIMIEKLKDGIGYVR